MPAGAAAAVVVANMNGPMPDAATIKTAPIDTRRTYSPCDTAAVAVVVADMNDYMPDAATTKTAPIERW